jgi:hypothetical protein
MPYKLELSGLCDSDTAKDGATEATEVTETKEYKCAHPFESVHFRGFRGLFLFCRDMAVMATCLTV